MAYAGARLPGGGPLTLSGVPIFAAFKGAGAVLLRTVAISVLLSQIKHEHSVKALEMNNLGHIKPRSQ